MKKKVLFVCIHNSARSQMAEAWLNHICPDSFAACSAGLEPGKLNPLAVEVMEEVGIDISENTTKSAFEMYRSGAQFDYVITVCDESSAESCPVFPGVATRLHWNFADPSALTGDHGKKLAGTRKIRDSIRKRIDAWCEVMCGTASV